MVNHHGKEAGESGRCFYLESDEVDQLIEAAEGFRDKLTRNLRMWIDHHRTQEYWADESDYLFPPDGKGRSDHREATVVRDIVVEEARMRIFSSPTGPTLWGENNI